VHPAAGILPERWKNQYPHHRQLDPLQSIEVAAIRLALQHKDDMTVLKSLNEVELEQGLSVGAAWLVYQVAKDIGI